MPSATSKEIPFPAQDFGPTPRRAPVAACNYTSLHHAILAPVNLGDLASGPCAAAIVGFKTLFQEGW